MVMAMVLLALSVSAMAEESTCIGTHETIEVNGVSLYYEVAGEGKPVVLVHGNGGSHEALHTITKALVASGYKVYAVDSRGQGANARLDEYHYADMGEDMYQFITALGLEKPAYYGWSDGGIIGLTLEIAHPGTVSMMAISGTNLTPDGATPEIIAMIEEMVKANPDPCSEMMLVEPQIDAASLAGVTCPVLVTAGSEDVILADHTKLIADSLPASELVIVDGHGHETYIQDSDIMPNMLLVFLKAHQY